MTKQEAIQAMREGHKLTHRYFTPEEWVKTNQSGTTYILEDGVECTPQEFWMWRTDAHWDSDWELWKEKQPKNISSKPLLCDVSSCRHVYNYHWKRGRCIGSKCIICGHIDRTMKPSVARNIA